MPSNNLEARVASLRKAHSDQTSKSIPVREPYSSWDGERVTEWLAEQKVDGERRRASVQEQTELAFLEVVGEMSMDIDREEGKKKTMEKEPKMGIERWWTTGEVAEEASVLTGVGAFAGDETPRYVEPLEPLMNDTDLDKATESASELHILTARG